MNIQINIQNGTGRNIELVFGQATVRVGLFELQNLVERASKYQPELLKKQWDIFLARQEEINNLSSKSEFEIQHDFLNAVLNSGHFSKLSRVQNTSAEQLSNYMIMLSNNETQEMLRRSSSNTLIPLLRHFRNIGEEEVESKIASNMAPMAAQFMRDDIDLYKDEISDEKANELILETTHILREMDREGLVCWEPNILKTDNPGEYQLVFGQTTIKLTEAETNAFLDQAIETLSTEAKKMAAF